jgi:thiosulfate dehydrogenase [quinone] large subunit
MNSTSYLLLRLAIGASFFGHGLVRIPKLSTFSNWMADTFSKSMLPRAMVLPFSYLLPILEFVIGLLCITGLFTQQALIGGCLDMALLIFGCCMIENWEPIVSQLVHVIVLVVLIQFMAVNTWAIDNLL